MARLVRDIAAIPDRHAINPFTRQAQTIVGRPAQRDVFEYEVEGTTVRTAKGAKADDPSTIKVSATTFATPELALLHAFKLGRKHRRRGYRLVGRSRVLDTSVASTWIVVEDLFETESPRFLAEILRFDEEPRLARFADKWRADERPWARQQLLAYVDDGCDRHGHRGLVKHLLRGAEAAGDDELMAHLMVAFDRLIVRVFGDTKRPATMGTPTRRARPAGFVVLSDPSVRSEATSRVDPAKKKKAGRPERFSRATRRYLMRRAWRYFRVLGHRDPKRYGTAIRAALALYEDVHLSTPLRFLDAWGLLNALYHGSDVLRFEARGVEVELGRTLGELTPSPRFPDAWSGVFDELVPMLVTARCRPVRRAVATLLDERYARELAGLGVRKLAVLLESEHEEAQSLGVRLLATAKGGASLAVDDWLRLLATDSAEVVGAVVTAMRAHLDPKALGIAQLVELAMARVNSVAALAADWIEHRGALSRADLGALLRLKDAPIREVRRRALARVAAALEGGDGDAEWVRDLVDAREVDARRVGLALLERHARYRDAPTTFLALVESPYGDVQAFAVREAEGWLARAAPEPSLRALWATLVLSVHRGSRAKLTALRQIVEALARPSADAAKTADLAALLAIALRSVRGPEKVAALSALAAASVRSATARQAIARAAPELRIGEVVSS